MAQTVIPNGVQAIEFRNRVVDNFMADAKGSIFVGTGNSSTNCSNAYIVETINPINNIVSGLQSNTIKLPIYTGTGNTGMAFVNAPNIVVGRAETLGTTAAACSVGGAATPVYFVGGQPVACTNSSIQVGHATNAAKLDTSAGGAATPVYFSGGKPVACTNSSIQVGHATNAAKLDGGTKGNSSTPVYIKSDGTPAACTNSSMHVGYATELNPNTGIITNLSGAAALPSDVTGSGVLLLLFRVEESSGINNAMGTAVIYNYGTGTGAKEGRAISELPFTNLSSSYSIWVRFKTSQDQLYWQVAASPGYTFNVTYLQVIKLFGVWL